MFIKVTVIDSLERKLIFSPTPNMSRKAVNNNYILLLLCISRLFPLQVLLEKKTVIACARRTIV